MKLEICVKKVVSKGDGGGEFEGYVVADDFSTALAASVSASVELEIWGTYRVNQYGTADIETIIASNGNKAYIVKKDEVELLTLESDVTNRLPYEG